MQFVRGAAVALALSTSLFACAGGSGGPGVTISQQQVPRVWLLTVGVSQYDRKEFSLKYADRDARSIYDFFGSPQGGSVPEDRRYLLTNAQATRAKILGELQEIAGRSGEDDMIVVFLAMHAMGGVTDPFYFLTHDTDPKALLATGISDDDVKKAVSHAGAKRFVVLLDTCHAGSFGFDRFFGTKRALRGETTRVMLDRLGSLSAQGTAVLAAADPAEYSEEGEQWDGGHGVFTYHLLRGLGGLADQDGDGIITLRELFDYIYRPVANDTKNNQHPSFLGNGRLPLVVRAAEPPEPPPAHGGAPVSFGRTPAHGGTPVSFGSPERERSRTTSFQMDDNALKLPGAVIFETASDKISPVSYEVLEVVHDYLDAKPDISLLRIEGHTDSDGSARDNQTLSEKRALSVARWLVARGVACERLIPVGFGQSKPIVPNDTPENKAQNRRVRFVNAALRGRPVGGVPVDGNGKIAGDPCR